MNKCKTITLPDGDQIIVFDELIPKTFQESILKTVDGKSVFPWYLLRKVGHTHASNLKYSDPKVIDGGGFYHSVIDDGEVISKYFDYFRSILYFLNDKTGIEPDKIIRIRLRYTNQQQGHTNETYGPIHVDFTKYDFPYYTLLYYVEDSDGDTFLFDKVFNYSTDEYDPESIKNIPIVHRQSPKQGQGLLFNGHRYHSGNYPINYQSRIVINFDFTIK